MDAEGSAQKADKSGRHGEGVKRRIVREELSRAQRRHTRLDTEVREQDHVMAQAANIGGRNGRIGAGPGGAGWAPGPGLGSGLGSRAVVDALGNEHMPKVDSAHLGSTAAGAMKDPAWIHGVLDGIEAQAIFAASSPHTDWNLSLDTSGDGGDSGGASSSAPSSPLSDSAPTLLSPTSPTAASKSIIGKVVDELASTITVAADTIRNGLPSGDDADPTIFYP
ncbi:uncharacterized protein AMSG_11816 [Thecamonas trahens ATCC 50062]|uniref:Uncharacterized protein n=1 Tax=Thecamonas trahens ATCC 50062 TaxID=461836 RepID=A0A0L0DCF3_THETB|nr:hypothetical protein AMSG_11816 [Thecamonas trahens ATCC 50062]KNC48988.1 hypothetical protein AMSG_11816 [Thecamonas trahens ATCC 50062]|eukprot:XP_013758452.1 hypothetical protein AMSG_11816 [Thecamonas trahens ATCC 50062]